MLGHFSCVQLFVSPWTVACQAPLSMGFSKQRYQNGLPFPPPGDPPDPVIEPTSFMSLALAGGFFTTSTTWEALIPSAKVKEIKAKINKWDQIQLINVVQQNNNLLNGRKCLQMI